MSLRLRGGLAPLRLLVRAFLRGTTDMAYDVIQVLMPVGHLVHVRHHPNQLTIGV